MTSKIKQKIARNLYESIHTKYYQGQFEDFLQCFKLIKSKDDVNVHWKCTFPSHPENEPNADFFKNKQREFFDNGTLSNLKFNNLFNKNEVEYTFNLRNFVKDILESDPTQLSFQPKRQKLIFEFSSPNIAKPFHVGHLRSTMIGNCLSNIKTKLGKDVVRMNYLGDWGTQFGMIQVGANLLNLTDEDFKKDPITQLFQAYVKGNRESERDKDMFDKAKNMFLELESENEELIKMWQKFREWTMEELSKTYTRLGVRFDEYCWESDYKRKYADVMLKMLEEKGMLSIDDKGRKVVRIGGSDVPLIKSDDTTLYLMRDLMAVADRRNKHNFDEMYYVVENGQNLHFNSLFHLCKNLGLSEGKKLEHIKFGRIQGMSTRKGKVTFLTDVLQEAKELAYEGIMKSKNTRANMDVHELADILGVSAVVVNDLKQSRKKDYEFSWENIIRITGDTGVHMQYCYCRLNSLQERCGKQVPTECDPEALMEPEAINLIFMIAKYEEVLLESDRILEPCALVNYLLKLVRATNGAIKRLNVKDSGDHLGEQRLLMFVKAKEVLKEGLDILGLKAVTQM